MSNIINLNHFNLNTGRTVVTPRHEFERLGRIAWPFSVEFSGNAGSAVATICGPTDAFYQMAVIGVAWDRRAADNLWDCLTESARKMGIVPRGGNMRKPSALPWCVSLRFETPRPEDPDVVRMLPEFERCMAWALLERSMRLKGVA